MNKMLLVLILFLSFTSINLYANSPVKSDEASSSQEINHHDKELLSKTVLLFDPESYKKLQNIDIYYDLQTDFLTLDPMSNLQKLSFPVRVDFEGEKACMLACMTENPGLAEFFSRKYGNIVGLMKVKGEFDKKNICRPYGVNEDNYSNDDFMMSMCEESYPKSCIKNTCTINGNLGEIFAPQNIEN